MAIRIDILLVISALLLGGVITIQVVWQSEPTHTENNDSVVVNTPQSATPPTFAVPPLEELADFRDRPLFAAGRTFARHVEVVDAPPPEPETEPDTEVEQIVALDSDRYVLSAVVLDSGDQLALVWDGRTDTMRAVRVDDDIDGWVIAGIESQRIVLEHGAEETELRLRPELLDSDGNEPHLGATGQKLRAPRRKQDN